MPGLTFITSGLNVYPPLRQVLDAPDLWGKNPERTGFEASPHRETLDIWLRFRRPEELHEIADYDRPHWSVWWPAMERLPLLKPLIMAVAWRMQATHLGGCLMTKIPAGCQVYPHKDLGWHATMMNAKVYIILQANERCINRCGDDEARMAAGSVWRFDNAQDHSVVNGGDTDRIAVIATMRTED